MDYFVHIANVLYLFSYLVRDILWLRLLTVVAILCLIPFFYFRTEPLMAPIYWNVLFTVINVYQIWLLFLERRPANLSDREQRLYHLVFRTLTPREMLKLLQLADWNQAKEGERIVEQGVDLESIMVIYDGHAVVEVDNNEVAKIHEGQFVGEMSFLTDKKTSAAVIATDGTKFVKWPKQVLKDFLAKNADLRAALQMVIGRDLVGKLHA